MSDAFVKQQLFRILDSGKEIRFDHIDDDAIVSSNLIRFFKRENGSLFYFHYLVKYYDSYKLHIQEADMNDETWIGPRITKTLTRQDVIDIFDAILHLQGKDGFLDETSNPIFED
ncbi:Hypothetical protein POVR1_LOCUS216 [uncultured virus]|nr:Hypothetical protein POVR1_LOCUS216 [uncultured virus]